MTRHATSSICAQKSKPARGAHKFKKSRKKKNFITMAQQILTSPRSKRVFNFNSTSECHDCHTQSLPSRMRMGFCEDCAESRMRRYGTLSNSKIVKVTHVNIYNPRRCEGWGCMTGKVANCCVSMSSTVRLHKWLCADCNEHRRQRLKQEQIEELANEGEQEFLDALDGLIDGPEELVELEGAASAAFSAINYPALHTTVDFKYPILYTN